MEILKPYREQIDALDEQIIDLLARRMDVIREVAAVKTEHDIPAALPERIDEVRENAVNLAEPKGLDGNLIRQLYTILIEHSCILEDDIKAQSNQNQNVGSL